MSLGRITLLGFTDHFYSILPYFANFNKSQDAIPTSSVPGRSNLSVEWIVSNIYVRIRFEFDY